MSKNVRCLLVGAAVGVAVCFLATSASGLPVQGDQSSGLEILVGGRLRLISTVVREGKALFRLQELASVLGVQLQESDDNLVVIGPKGRLVLNDGSRLVRKDELSILLSAEIWKRDRRAWYAPRDMVGRALQSILDPPLKRINARRFELTDSGQNPVRIELSNHEDHVRIVFHPEKGSSSEVTDQGKFLEVRFGDYRVDPSFPDRRPETSIVASLEFDSNDVSGAFRVYKGRLFKSFRNFQLDDPRRLVIDVFADTQVFPSATKTDAVPSGSAPVTEVKPGIAVVIDPGHGGGDQGITHLPDLIEKDWTLRLSLRLGQLFRDSGAGVFLTRNRDVTLPIERRTALANGNRPKAFVSIHVGGLASPSARGPLVYVHPSLGGADLDSSVPVEGASQLADLISWESVNQAHKRSSVRLAGLVQEELNSLFGTKNRIVEAPLEVLSAADSPAVLIEVGLATDPQDRVRLLREGFLEQVAARLHGAIDQFIKTMP